MDKLIAELKKEKTIVAPEWAPFVKTGAHKQRPPVAEDWWFVRSASVLKKIQKFGPIGTNRLAKQYGGRKDRGHKTEKKYDGSRNILRKVLQQLEGSGFVVSVKEPRAGKVLSKKGKELLLKVK